MKSMVCDSGSSQSSYAVARSVFVTVYPPDTTCNQHHQQICSRMLSYS